MDVASLLLKDLSGLGDRGEREQALSKLKAFDSCRCCHCSVKLSVPTPLTQHCLAWPTLAETCMSGGIYVKGDGCPTSRDVMVQEHTLACP